MQDGRTGWGGRARSGERAGTLVLVTLIHVGLALMLLRGLAPDVARRIETPLILLDLAPPPPPETPAPRAERRARQAPAPPAPKAEPKPIVAPPVRLPRPSKLTAAPVAGAGDAAASGVAATGSGTGAGDSGNGAGGAAMHAEWLTGAITDRDYPDAAKRAGLEGAVAILFTVRRDGRIADCRVDRSSGNAELDRMTCVLATERLRYAPARDAAGRPVEEVSGRYFRFVLGRRGR